MTIAFNNPAISNGLETYYLKNKNYPQYFQLIKEKIKFSQDIKSSNENFLSLIGFDYVSNDMINQYLEASHQSHNDIVKYLCESDKLQSLKYYLFLIKLHSTNPIEEFRKIITQLIYPNTSKQRWFEAILEIFEVTDQFCEILLSPHNFLKDFANFILIDYLYIYKMSGITNFLNYYHNKDKESFILFEQNFLKKLDNEELINYALSLPVANKRLILTQLIANNSSEDTMKFIALFPEFKKLIPFL